MSFSRLMVSGVVAAAASCALAEPQATTFVVDGTDRIAAVAPAPLFGLYATADTMQDRVEVRDIEGHVVRAVTRADMAALLPWMSLGTLADDGPVALAFSDSGRLLFMAVRDDNAAPDGLPGDAVLRLD